MLFHGGIGILDIAPDKARAFSLNVARYLDAGSKGPSVAIPVTVKKFDDGETDIHIEDSLRGRDVYLFQSYMKPLGERKYEFENAVSAARSGGGAERIIGVWPYCFGMRGERQTRARQSVPIEVWARSAYAMGVEQIITIGLHTDVIKTIFRSVGDRGGIRIEDLPFEPLAANYIITTAKDKGLDDIVIASPDAGGTKRAEGVLNLVYANSLLAPELAIGHKYRGPNGKTEARRVIGDVKGRSVFVYDDVLGTLGTIKGAVSMIEEHGAREIYLIFIHPVFAGGSERNLEALAGNPKVKEIVVGNTIPLPDFALKCPKVRQIPLEPFVAEAIHRINGNDSMSKLHEYDKIVSLYTKNCPTPSSDREVWIKHHPKPTKEERAMVEK